MTTQGMTQIITLKLPNQEDSQKLAFTVLNVFTDKECSEWIKVSEKHCYSPALLNIGIGEVSRPDIRNNDRSIIDDVDMAKNCLIVSNHIYQKYGMVINSLDSMNVFGFFVMILDKYLKDIWV